MAACFTRHARPLLAVLSLGTAAAIAVPAIAAAAPAAHGADSKHHHKPTVASVQKHFIDLYSCRDRQCKLGYDSSAACDSFQLGQMIKFLVSKRLLYLVDYGASSMDAVPDGSSVQIEELLGTLRQCPNYQIDKLQTANYPKRRGDVLALLMTRGSPRLVLGKKLRPVAQDSKAVTEAETEAQEKWDDRALRAAGEIYLSLSDDQKTHVEACNDDPVAMWKKLESVHLQKKPGMRFNAWEEFFSIQLEENESLSSLMTRIDTAMHKVQNLRPDTFTLDDLDRELVSMTMVRSLPSSYASFASSLQLLDKFDKDTLQAAFINEESLRTRSSTPGSTAVLSASTAHSSSSAALTCAFCSLPMRLSRCLHSLQPHEEAGQKECAGEEEAAQQKQGSHCCSCLHWKPFCFLTLDFKLCCCSGGP